MIKAVFFDLYYTLVRYEPPQEELESIALKGFGIDVKPEALRRPFFVANEFIYEELARFPLGKRSPDEKMALYARYHEIILKEAGIEATRELLLTLLGKMQQFKPKLVLFDDVAPALTDLQSRGLILGLISNVDSDITPMLHELGLNSWLQVVVTSQEVGYNKPQPEIFQAALKQARVRASEALYVGDQYRIDIVGAKNAGIKGVLLDRGNYYPESADYPRIPSLACLGQHLS